ncbi:UNVERIFIED_CONTAM: hypothetical protein Slati_0949600 [Sesamum latifolium]|uniref:RNase H type-1 domain-containing protein n=1 Tax=Sesamum latifolium TaxID=2727402 RepID=A0AAW2XSJ7_9LAMI
MDQHLVDLAETFGTLRKYHMKLDPAKCAFGVRSGKSLGYMVMEKGIEVNPKKILAIQEMKPPANLNEVQRLTRRIAALSRFISRSAERSLPFFKALRKIKDFVWDKECQQAFQDLKLYLARLHYSPSPIPGETLYLYLAACQQAPRSAIKVQALAEFVNEATFIEGNEGNWLLHANGSSTFTGSGAGVVFTSPEGGELEYAMHFDFKALNNEAEYEALIASIKMALDAGAKNLIACTDS